MPESKTTTPKPETAKSESATPQDAKPKTPPPVPPKMTEEESTLQQARNGDKTVLPRLHKLLEEKPQIWQDTGDLVRLTEQTWIETISSGNLLHRESLRCAVEQMRQDLAESKTNALERALIDRIVCCWLAVQHAEMAEAIPSATSIPLSQLQLKRLDSAQRRFLDACKALAQVRRLTAGIRIDITHHSEPTPREAVKDVIAERMRQENLVAVS